YVQYVQMLHKAPFDRAGLSLRPLGAPSPAQPTSNAAAPAVTMYRNIQVTRDRNPWPKAGLAAAVDPSSPGSVVVMTNDFRANLDAMFFHVSSDDGVTWTDDAMSTGNDPVIGPFAFQKDPGLSFDRSTNSYLSTLNGALYIDSVYENFDTEVDVARGFA